LLVGYQIGSGEASANALLKPFAEIFTAIADRCHVVLTITKGWKHQPLNIRGCDTGNELELCFQFTTS
jgi:hypothetical protein